MKWAYGNTLSPEVQAECKRRYIYRWTSDNHQIKQAWNNHEKPRIPLITDAEWLANTEFRIKSDGTLDNRAGSCMTHARKES